MDNLTKDQRRKNMQNIRSANTFPELLLMRALKKKKIKFLKHVKELPGKPDVFINNKKLAVFVDSDFWHGHKNRFTMPKTNRSYWRKKIAENQKRDKRINRLLKKDGWKVIRFWESEIKRNVEKCIGKISLIS